MAKVTKKKATGNEQPVGGERLRAARESNDMSVEKIAKELNLDKQKVRALENNEFESLGAPVFAKGHLRNYAKVVGVGVQDIMTDYYKMNRAAGLPPVIGTRRRVRLDIDPLHALIGLIVFLLIIITSYWFLSRQAADLEVAVIEPEALAPFVAEPTAFASVDDGEELEIESIVAEPQADSFGDDYGETLVAPAKMQGKLNLMGADSLPILGTSQMDIRLSFKGECWAEVSDNAGRRLFYDLGRDGRVVNISGDAPLQLVLGDAKNVEITVAGNPWPVAPSMLTGRPARLTIPAQ